MFRVIIAGGRNFNHYKLMILKMDKILKDVKEPICIISGTAQGADFLGEQYAKLRGYKLKQYPADWDDLSDVEDRFIRTNSSGKKYNSKAGMIRNKKMVDNADAAVFFWDKSSKGTKQCIEYAIFKKLKHRIIFY